MKHENALKLARAIVAPEIPAQLLTVPEACASLKVSRWTLYQLIRSRQLKTVKIGRRRCVPAVAIQALIDQLMDEEEV